LARPESEDENDDLLLPYFFVTAAFLPPDGKLIVPKPYLLRPRVAFFFGAFFLAAIEAASFVSRYYGAGASAAGSPV